MEHAKAHELLTKLLDAASAGAGWTVAGSVRNLCDATFVEAENTFTVLFDVRCTRAALPAQLSHEFVCLCSACSLCVTVVATLTQLLSMRLTRTLISLLLRAARKRFSRYRRTIGLDSVLDSGPRWHWCRDRDNWRL